MKIAFWALALLAITVASIYGGREGRWMAGLILVAAIATTPIQRSIDQWTTVAPGLLISDLLLFLGLLTTAIRSAKGWPIWIAGMQFNAVLASLAVWLSPEVTGRIYAAMETVWALPILLFMVVGPIMDHSRGLR